MRASSFPETQIQEPFFFMMPFSFFKEDDLVCYCFQHTRRQIEQDYAAHGRSLILAQIIDAKKAGGCDCGQKNPKGR